MGCLLAAGCSSLKHQDRETFLAQAEEISEIHSAKWTTFIGVSEGRVYLEHGRVASAGAMLGFGSKVVVFWTELEHLPDELVKEIKAGNNPWKPESKAKTKD